MGWIVARLFNGRDHLADEALRHEENAASRKFSAVVISFNLQRVTFFFGGPFQSFMGFFPDELLDKFW